MKKKLRNPRSRNCERLPMQKAARNCSKKRHRALKLVDYHESIYFWPWIRFEPSVMVGCRDEKTSSSRFGPSTELPIKDAETMISRLG